MTTDKDRDVPENDTDGGEEKPEPDAVPADTSEDAATEVPPNRWWPRRVLTAATTAIVVGALTVSGFLGWQLWEQRQVDQAGDAAEQAAVEYAQVLTSIDSEKVDENFAQVLDGATGEFKDMYSQSSTQLRQLLIDNQAMAHGVVIESAVQSAGKDEVVVLLFIDQTVSNTNVPDPRIDRSRVKMTMQHVDDRWRAAKVALP